MSTINSLSVSYADNSITTVLSTGESIVVSIDITLPNVTGESLAQSETRKSRLIDALIKANVRALKSSGDVTTLDNEALPV